MKAEALTHLAFNMFLAQGIVFSSLFITSMLAGTIQSNISD